ncbi:MAG TPA: BatD family protein [Candidatus Omnitrophota bacterium]|nr:BatD family protein [Candidatus Omnitrophota bacterium]
MKKIFVAGLALFTLANMSLAEISVSASVDKNTVGLDDAVNYTITISGGEINNAPEPSLPALENLTAVSNFSSSNISIINGQTSSSFSYTYVLKPGNIGPAQIGQTTVTIGGQSYSTRPIAITVTRATGHPVSRSASGSRGAGPLGSWENFFDDFFTRPSNNPFGAAKPRESVLAETSVSQKTAYVNQLVILTFTFLRQGNLFEAPTYLPPETTGFWTVNLPVSRDLRQVNRSGGVYLAQDFKTALFPTATGTLKIGPARLTVKPDPFAAAETIATKPITITVLPLPEEGKPAGFSGSVGKYALSASISTRETERGHPVSLTVKVFGEGNIQTISEPAFPDTDSIKKLSTSSKENIEKGFGSVSGSKTFEMVLMPLKEGMADIGPLKFSYFDPQAKKYIDVLSPVFKLNILPSNVPLPKELSAAGQKTENGGLKISFDWKGAVKKVFRFLSRPVIMLLIIIVFASALALWVIGKFREYELSDPARMRRKRALKLAKDKLKRARGLLRSGKLKDFIAEIYLSVSNYLGDKYGFASSGLTTDQLKDTLHEKGIDAGTLQNIESFIEECDLIRFTPSALDGQKASALSDSAEKLIIHIESGS